MTRGHSDRALAHDLLKRAVGAKKCGAFRLRELCPRDATSYLRALEKLVNSGFVERVGEGCGKWHYRLTETGLAAAEAGEAPVFTPDADGASEDDD